MSRTEPIKVAVVNQCTALSDKDVAAGVAAIQKQVSRDFAPVWNVDARLRVVGRGEASTKLPDHWGLVLADDRGLTDQLGYHQLTSAGLPMGVVHVRSIPTGRDWTHTASHELLEMLTDADSDLAVCIRADGGAYRVYAREVCDPCAAYDDGYAVDGRWVSDFVFPQWFQPDALTHPRDPGANGRFDERGLIRGPFELRPGGYIGLLDQDAQRWRLVGHLDEEPSPIAGATRMTNRTAGRDTWQLSDMAWSP